jgi:hypothetical protein
VGPLTPPGLSFEYPRRDTCNNPRSPGPVPRVLGFFREKCSLRFIEEEGLLRSIGFAIGFAITGITG